MATKSCGPDGAGKVLTRIVENMKQKWGGASGFLGCVMIVTKILVEALVANELANID
jgi:hypothetical protein